MADTKVNQGGHGAVSGHAGQAARELMDELQHKTGPATVLVPNPADVTGFRVLTLGMHHRDGMKIDDGRLERPPLPATALLDKLKDVDRSITFIPQVFSAAAQRNVRCAVVLPKNFDSSKTYEVVGLTPDRPPGTTLAEALGSKQLAERIADIPGAADKIVVLPERLEHRRDAIDGPEHDKLAEAILTEDLLPYVVAGFGGAVSGFSLEKFGTGSSSIVDGLDDMPTSMPTFSTSESYTAPSSSSAVEFAKKLAKVPTALMIRKGRDAASVPAGKVDGDTLKNLAELPDNFDLGQLKNVDRNVVILAKTGKSPFALIVPPNFDRTRTKPYKIAAYVPPDGAAFGRVAKELATKGGTGREDTIVVVAHRPKGHSVESVRRRTEYEVLAHIHEAGIDVDLSTYSSTELGKKADGWRAQIQTGKTSARRLQSPIISEDGRWTPFPPTSNYRLAFPDPAKTGGTEAIPKAVQKQTANQGSMIVPTMKSDALGKRTRFATYLPPGYDPDSKERYPVVVMLPGKGNTLNVWSSAGDMVPKLDRMMRGDAQKMIVMIPESNDSFWYDYDKNGTGDFREKEKRDYEGHVMELVDYATKELKGDKKRLSIGGISRGGFGAVSIAARHPGMFKSVSAHAALLDLSHGGGVLGPNLTGAIRGEGHFGPPDDPVWAMVNPGDLVRGGAFQGKGAPKLYLDVGFEDAIAGDQTLGFSELLREKGVDHTLHVATSPEIPLEHKWAAWEGMLESWVGFHQGVHGTARKPRVPTGWYDGKKEGLEAYRTEQTARRELVTELNTELLGTLEGLTKQVEALFPQLTDLLPFEWIARNEDNIRAVPEMAKALAKRVRAEVNLDKMPLHAAEAWGEELAIDVANLQEFVNEAHYHVDWRFVGERIEPPKADPKALQKIHADAKKSLDAVIKAVPEAKNAVMRLATARPELFTEDKDSVTEGRFADQLAKFIEDGVLKNDEREGFVEFLDRMAVKRFDWRRGGYSHSVCSSMNIVYNHPGIILNMIRSARADKPYKVKAGVYSGDGPRTLKPLGDMKAGFRPVDWVRYKDPKHDLPPAQLGYERGFLRAIVDVVSPSPMSMPDNRFGVNAGPVAVSIQKLTGQETNYLYANKIKNGDDLAKAVASQGVEGLAMADVYVSFGDYEPIQLHFPVFYDLDMETRTVVMQEWDRPAQRLDLDEMKFDINPEKKHGIALICRPTKDLQPFLTPEDQSNWDKIRPDKPKKSRGFFKPSDKWID